MCAQPCRTTKVVCDDLVLKGVYYDLYSTTHITMKKFIQRYSKAVFGKEKHVLSSADSEYLCRFGILSHDNKVFSAISFINSHIYTSEFVSYLSRFAPGTFRKMSTTFTDEDDYGCDEEEEEVQVTETAAGCCRQPSPPYFKRPTTPAPTVRNTLGSEATPAASFIVKIPSPPTTEKFSEPTPEPTPTSTTKKRAATPTSGSKKPLSKILKLANSTQK